MPGPGRRELDDDDLLRYSRHVLLADIGIEGQARFAAAHALIVGAGGLGSPAALFLGSAGIGRMTIADGDRVDLTNLQRQIAHDMSRIGTPKARSAASAVTALNPKVVVVAVEARLAGAALDERVREADVVVDCSDNFATRQAVNAACVRHAKPLVSAAAIGFDAQVSVWDTRREDAPCYACAFPASAPAEDAACATMGVFAPLVGIAGSLQAAEVLKLVAGIGTSLAGRLQMLDARTMEWTQLQVPRDPSCTICSDRPGAGPLPSPAAPPRGAATEGRRHRAVFTPR